MFRPERHYSLVAVKLDGFAGRSRHIQVLLRGAMHDVVRLAAADARLPWHDFVVEDRAEGVLLLVPGPTSPADLAGGLVSALVPRLRDHYTVGGDHMRLRVALHQGLATEDVHGWAGGVVDVAWQLADAPVLGGVLAAAIRAHLVLIVSDPCFAGLVASQRRSVDTDAFRQVRVAAVAGADLGAWVYVPDYAVPPGLPPQGLVPRPASARRDCAPRCAVGVSAVQHPAPAPGAGVGPLPRPRR